MPPLFRSFRLIAILLAGIGVLAVHAARADAPGVPPPAPPPSRDTRPLGPAAGTPPTPLTRGAPPSSGMSTVRTVASLAVVLGVIFGGAALFRRVVLKNPTLAASLGAGGRAPAGILEIIGRYPIGRGASLILLRLDHRILLLSQSAAPGGRGLIRSGASALTTLCEITGPDEVASILAKARDDEGESLAAKFQTLLHGMSGEHDTPAPDASAPAPEQAAAPAVVVRTPTWSAFRGGAA